MTVQDLAGELFLIREQGSGTRALMEKPNILLLDEPLSALDRKIRGEMDQAGVDADHDARRIEQHHGGFQPAREVDDQ